jgi:NTP pyrophosphatase (non-canonical NTP hydrolase)
MDFQSYQQAALRTDNDALSIREGLSMAALGLAGEAGEAAGRIKKELYHGHAPSRDAIAAELGDVLWYLAVLSHRLGLSLQAVAEGNITKLRERYPEGFSEAASRCRS